MFQWSLEFIFITLSILAVTVITTGQNALGTSASDIFDRNLTGNDGHRQSSPLKGMNFSETSEVYSHKGILETTIIIDEHEGMVGNEPVIAMTYNGSLNGPTLHIKPGERMVLYYVNKLDQPTNIHFHGLHVSPLGQLRQYLSCNWTRRNCKVRARYSDRSSERNFLVSFAPAWSRY